MKFIKIVIEILDWIRTFINMQVYVAVIAHEWVTTVVFKNKLPRWVIWILIILGSPIDAIATVLIRIWYLINKMDYPEFVIDIYEDMIDEIEEA